MADGCEKNTDREIWRETEGDYYSPSIHVTEAGGIGINVGGYVFVKSVQEWHKCQGQLRLQTDVAIGAKSIAKQLRAENDKYIEAITACRDCNDVGESYNSPTADSAQALANLFSMIEDLP